MVDDLIKLHDGLREMPVPEPRAGFVDRVLAKASRRKAEPQVTRSSLHRPSTWWAASAIAAALATVVILWNQQRTAAEPSLQLALNESREVSLVIDSERELEDATIRLYVSGSVELAGYEDEHEIEWLTSLKEGANLLSLPVIARAPGDGRVVAVIEHQGRTRRVSVAMHVAAPG